MKGYTYIILFIVSLVLLTPILCGGCRRSSSDEASTSLDTLDTEEVTSPVEAKDYAYFDLEERQGTIVHFAQLESDNSVRLASSEAQDAFLTYTIRQGSSPEPEVYLSISSGELVSASESDREYYVSVRVGAEQEQTFRYSVVSHGEEESRHAFLDEPAAFIALVRQAQELRIEVPLVGEGRRVFRFTTSKPLIWGTTGTKPAS